LIGIQLGGLTDKPNMQLTLFDAGENEKLEKFDEAMLKLQLKHGRNIVKTANELQAEENTRDILE